MKTLCCEGVSKSFDGVRALDEVSIRFPSAGIVAVIGPNGAGKTTLLNALTGFVRPDGGRFCFGGDDMTQLPPHRIALLGIARTFQDVRLIKQVSVLENVMLARPRQGGEQLLKALSGIGVRADEAHNRKEAQRLLRFVDLSHKTGELAGEISYGQQKLLTLACCLATNAGILLLDEPVAGVHSDLVARLLDLLLRVRDEGKLVVFVEHDLAAVREVADRVIVMDEGRIVADGVPSEVLQRPEIMEAYVG
jgi:ABC-type branched-subunit amino acid transport system ATPase component